MSGKFIFINQFKIGRYMRAAVYKKYGSPDVLKVEEVAKPTPKENEVLIKIKAASVTAGDCEVRRFDISPFFWLPVRLYMGILTPRKNILGQELAGVIEEVGEKVTKFKKGDQVFAATEMDLGAHAEYICLAADGAISRKPKNLSFEESAALPVGALNSLYFFHLVGLKKNQKILINGAGGSIGTIAVQYAKLIGAEVSAVDTTNKLDILHKVGADKVIDYTKQDFTKNDELYDIIFEVSGKISFSRCKNSLSPNGIFISANPTLLQMFIGFLTKKRNGKKLITGMAKNNPADLDFIKNLVEEEKVKPVIDKSFSLEEIQDAHRYVESGEKKGNVIIKMGNS